MSPPNEKPDDPREAYRETIWLILRNAYVRAATGGKIPRRQADRTAAIAHLQTDLEHDYRAMLETVKQAAIVEVGIIQATLPRPPELEDAPPPPPRVDE